MLQTDEPKVVRKIKKAKVTISAEEYDQIRELLKLILRHDEEGKDLTYPGMLWRDLRNAYLEKVSLCCCGGGCLCTALLSASVSRTVGPEPPQSNSCALAGRSCPCLPNLP